MGKTLRNLKKNTMAHESIRTLMRPGFPKEVLDERSYRNTIEYVGKYADLKAANCRVGITWGEYPGRVTVANAEPLENSEYAILVVVVESKFGEADYPEGGTGTLGEIVHEIDWNTVHRSLYEHPKFAEGGEFALADEDRIALKNWERMPDAGYKEDFIYATNPDTWEGGASGTGTLSANAQELAKGILIGIDHWEDFAPVARKTSTYSGGPPPEGDAGLKETPTGFPNLPDGYEWVKTADRSVKSGGQTKWRRSEEWTGSDKVLIDRANIYW